MDPAWLCKAFFGLGTVVDIGGTLIPSFRQQIMNYGSRGSDQNSATVGIRDNKFERSSLFGIVASFQVPHTWFTHYYMVSVASSIFWAVQISIHGRAFQFLAFYSQPSPISGTMSVNQVILAWLFMMVQGTRRLYECITLTKPSQSKMWVGLWAIGIAYYIFMGISIWIEGIAALNATESPLGGLEISKPSLKTIVAVPLFVFASWSQHECHKHLASLKKYTLPQHKMFQSIVCPHYTSECLIYVALAILAAPTGQIMNRTILAGLVFVVSNLAVTADATRTWYVEKFGADKLEGRWRLVPYLY